MNSAVQAQEGFHVSASGGVLIGVLLAALVILGGFSLVPTMSETAQTDAFPTWVDQRFAESGPYQTIPTTMPQLSKPVSVARMTTR